MPKKTVKKKTVTSRVRPRWTKEEVALLKRLYRTHSNADIAQILGRKVSSVVFKGHRLGLAKGARRLKEMGRENIARRWEPIKQKASKKAAASKKATAAKKTTVAKKAAATKKVSAARKRKTK
ncbi:MAG: hypothetical protein JXR49_21150 [Acidobacteria bacterium]|nr:hypothetical protein [Acidobacteriota bacterium]